MHSSGIAVKPLPLGEIRMGCEAWGLSVDGGGWGFSALCAHPVLVGSADWEERTHQSLCGKFLVVEGAFFTFVLSLEDQTLSLYKATVRDNNGTWCEETPIYREDTRHLDGQNGKHYYIQFPFFPDEKFWEEFRAYEKLRLAQIEHARHA
jgi:hypothetical protein